MSKPVKISTVLTRAAKYIEEHGFTQGHLWKYRNGRVPNWADDMGYLERATVAREKGCKACALGAIYAGAAPSLKNEVDLEATWAEATSYLDDLVGKWPPRWNDEPGRTQDEVVQALKDAAKAARKDGK